MTITIDLTPEEEARLQAEARGQGLEASEFLRRLWLGESLIVRDGEGCPTLSGTSVRVSLVVSMHKVQGHTAEEIAEDVFPHLSLHQVQSALRYYERHKGEIEAELEAEQRLIHDLRAKSDQPSREEYLRRLQERQSA